MKIAVFHRAGQRLSVAGRPLYALRVDPHRIGELRSLAYHREVEKRVRADSTLIGRARAVAQAWLAEQKAPHLMRAWLEILEGPSEGLTRVLTEDTERARDLRSASPFAGTLSPKERWRIWALVREQCEALS
jgi:hypothetical protein